MALSAFRSTTKRSCQIGTNDASVPATPRSRRESSREPPSGRSSHRRSSSMTDFSPKYFSDCSSTSDYRPYKQSGGRRGGRSSVCPSDSESEIESRLVYQQPRPRHAESEDERHLNPSLLVTNVGFQREGLGRTSSLQDFSKHESKLRLPSLIPHSDGTEDNLEDFAEEKTIRAVYAQMKSLRTDPPVVDLCSSDFLDAMRSEVRQAVTEIRMELDESMRKNCKSSEIPDEARVLEGTNVMQAVVDIRNEYSTKLEQSEKRVRELWSQLAVEEQRCVELTKIVKELLPSPPSSGPHTVARSTSYRRRSHKRRNSAEKQVVSVNLDNEAQKYFEECVSISALDCQGDMDDSFSEIDQQSKYMKGGSCEQTYKAGETVKKSLDEVGAKNKTDVLQGEKQPKGRSAGNDGVVLPWLQWEAEGGANNKNLKKVAKRYLSPTTSSTNSSLFNRGNNGSNNPFYTNGHARLNSVRKPSSVEGKVPVVHSLQTLSPRAAMGDKIDKLKNENASDKSGLVVQAPARSSLFTNDDRLTQMDQCFPNVDTQLLERIQLKCRIESGELLLCQGLFL